MNIFTRSSVGALALLVNFSACTSEAGQDESTLGQPSSLVEARHFKVMTRNVYVGTDVDRVVEATNPAEIPFIVAELWEMLLATKTEERMRAIAAEIDAFSPHLVGLQEVSLFRTQFPGDLVVGGSSPAQDVAFDFLAIILDELAARGRHYYVAGIIQDTDAEVPRINQDFTFTDVRLTDFDVVLARGDVQVSNVVARNYTASLPAPSITVLRGYIILDAELQGLAYRFANTHLEPRNPFPQIQQAQAAELVEALAGEVRPTVAVGDFNTVEGDLTYQILSNAGLVDAWLERQGPDVPGYTSNHGDLQSGEGELDRRIDLVWFRNLVPQAVLAQVVGDDLEDKTASGLWPSDHAGVAAHFVH